MSLSEFFFGFREATKARHAHLFVEDKHIDRNKCFRIARASIP
jgi:hypothetical protein